MAQYWQRIDIDPALVATYAALLTAIRYRTQAAAVAREPIQRDIDLRKRLEMDLVLHRLWRDLEKLAIKSSARADGLIRARIKKTQVRPDTPGPHMIDNVLSRPLPSTFPLGMVGIADIDVLDRTVNPRAPQAGPFWLAQEFGTRAHIGRKVPGFFQPGRSVASQGEFRVHPYFEQSRGKGTPAMVIKRPIQARHFLRDGAAQAVARHLVDQQQITGRATGSLARL